MAEKATSKVAEKAPKASALAIGDHVRLKARVANQHKSFQVTGSEVASNYEPVDGLVFSIRDIATGDLVAATASDPSNYVIELLINRTFNTKFASMKNAPRTSEQESATPAYKKVRKGLRDAANAGQFFTSIDPASYITSPLAKQLDGWKIIKVWSKDIALLARSEHMPAG